ncbi:MFS transporter [Umezawaea tangerina]|uniref:Putative MFS family arabinose efflux permease n=1 Tax=Umezawaea tangerina TaxID=84725 RepID=A0A2T0TDE4_9PSEU|nr:MFS transporter [Umezawaea tangerina]PRY43685.1 putative MFS family arabinose efflux permease [Umezawaea tangerina]
MLRPYRQLAGVPHLVSVLIWSMVGRVHMTGTPLALSFLMAGWTGSYGLAGVVGGALTLGLGVAGPVRGRAADRAPASRLLAVAGGLYGVGIALLGLLPTVLPAGGWPVAVVVAFLTGLCTPPVTQLTRASYPRLATGPVQQAVYTVEASLQEFMYIVGPMMAASLVAFASPRTAIWVCGVLAVAGTFGFLLALRRAGLDEPVPMTSPHSGRSLLKDGGLVLTLVAAVCVVMPLVTVDMLIIAWARDLGRPAMAGVLTAVWGVGSVLGGLVVGGFRGRANFPLRMVMLTVGMAALIPVLPPVTTPSSPWLIGAVLVLGGLAIAPAIAANNARIGDLAPDGRKAEAFGWMSMASTAGAAAALPTAGWLLDHIGPSAAAVSATAVALVGTVLATRVRAAAAEVAEPKTST